MKAGLNTILMFGLVILFAGFANAAVLSGSIINSPQTASHNSDVTVTFNVTYDGTAATTNLSFSDSTSNIGTWKTLPAITPIEKGKTLTFSATLNVPKFASGAINAVIKVKEDGTTTQISIAVPAITITESPSFAFAFSNGDTEKKITVKEDVKLKIENTGNTPLNLALTSNGDFGTTITPSIINLPKGGDKNENITLVLGDLSGLKFGDYSVKINAKDSAKNIEQNIILTFTKSFCKSGDTNGNLSIRKIRIESDGEDEEIWKPLDTLTLEVEVENNGDKNIRDVVVELGLFDSEGKDNSGDLEFLNDGEEKFDIGTIDDDSKETATFEFKVPADIETGDYKLAIKAYSEDLGESKECTSESGDLDNDLYQEISIESETDEDKFIVFNNIEINPAGDLTCGDQITVSADVYNIGDEDQDQVKVVLSNSELRLNEEKIIRDLNAEDSSKVTFNFNVPNGLQDKLYILKLGAQYDYRNGIYRESGSRTEDITLNIAGCKAAPAEKISTITATLGSDAQAGKELIVKITLTGLLQEADYVVTASGFESWAELNSISERLIHLRKGESKEITLGLNVKEKVGGEQSFNVQAISGGKAETQEIAVNIGETGSETGGLNLGGNSLIWIIGIINVILIILIIVVAARISRR